MEIFLNSVDPEVIKNLMSIYPLAGVTTNHKMIGALGKVPYADTIRAIREACGEKKFFTQVVSPDYEGMLKEAEYICKLAGDKTYVKLPSNEVGVKAIRTLHNSGYNTCGTLVFSTIQATMMLEAGADYVASFYSYMVNRKMDPDKMMAEIAAYIKNSGCKGKLMGAGFRTIEQVGIGIGSSDCININPDNLVEWMAYAPATETAQEFLDGFEEAWGVGTTILDFMQ